jgi:hypothetical protein
MKSSSANSSFCDIHTKVGAKIAKMTDHENSKAIGIKDLKNLSPISGKHSNHAILREGELPHLLWAYKGGRPVSRMIQKIKSQPNYATLTGQLTALKDQLLKVFQSPLERDYLVLLDFDADIQSFDDQPLTIEYLHDGRSRTYTPDVLVHHRSRKRPALTEIKSTRDLELNGKEYEARFQAARQAADNRGWDFVVLTESDIHTPFFENAKFLLPFRRYPRLEPEFQLVGGQLVELGESTPRRLVEAASNRMKTDNAFRVSMHPDSQIHQGRLLAMIWKNISEHWIKADLSGDRLTQDSKIWPAFQPPGTSEMP